MDDIKANGHGLFGVPLNQGMTGNCLHRQFSLTDPFVPTD